MHVNKFQARIQGCTRNANIKEADELGMIFSKKDYATKVPEQRLD